MRRGWSTVWPEPALDGTRGGGRPRTDDAGRGRRPNQNQRHFPANNPGTILFGDEYLHLSGRILTALSRFGGQGVNAFAHHPENAIFAHLGSIVRPAGTFSPTWEKAGMRGRSNDSTASYWEMVLSI